MSPISFSELVSPGGYKMGEVASALQKSIRRGLEEDALFWASELDIAGYGNYAWKRLRKIASEDIGVAERGVAADVRALYENWQDERKADKRNPNPGRLFLMHAVILLVNARKSRRVDHAGITMYEYERPAREMPDWALDRHTARGRRMGRGNDHFFAVGAVLVDAADGPFSKPKRKDPYIDRARLARAKGYKKSARGQQALELLDEAEA